MMKLIPGKFYRVREDCDKRAHPISFPKGVVGILLSLEKDPRTFSDNLRTMIDLEFLINDQVKKIRDADDWISDWLEGPL